MNYEEALKKLRDYAQEHVLAYYEGAYGSGKGKPAFQIELTEFFPCLLL